MDSSILTPKTASIADKINDAHLACLRSASDALNHAMRCGDLLAEAKAGCEHGTWQTWLSENFQGSKRTAQGYMRLAANRDKIEAKAQGSAFLGIEAAMQLVAKPRPVASGTPNNIKDDNSLAEMLAEPRVWLGCCFNRGHKLAQLTPCRGESEFYHVLVAELPQGIQTETKKGVRREYVSLCLNQMGFAGDDWEIIDEPILEPTPLMDWWKMEGVA